MVIAVPGKVVRFAMSVPVAIFALAILAVRGVSPETILVLALLWVVGAVSPRAWEFWNGRLGKVYLLQNVFLYATFLVIIAAEYLLLEGDICGVPKEVAMFFTAWLLTGIFEFLRPGFARKEANQPS